MSPDRPPPPPQVSRDPAGMETEEGRRIENGSPRQCSGSRLDISQPGGKTYRLQRFDKCHHRIATGAGELPEELSLERSASPVKPLLRKPEHHPGEQERHGRHDRDHYFVRAIVSTHPSDQSSRIDENLPLPSSMNSTCDSSSILYSVPEIAARASLFPVR